MNEFSLYFGIGVEHILSFGGLDHLLFIVALTAVYQWQDWRKLLVLITAFTMGHSLTLALATLGWIVAPSYWIELLIPITIAATSISNLFKAEKKLNINYTMALLFGLIHGMGFSASLRALLGGQSLLIPLLGFNLGLETGQAVVVFLFLMLSLIFVKLLSVSPRDWKMVISSIIIGAASMMIKERIF